MRRFSAIGVLLSIILVVLIQISQVNNRSLHVERYVREQAASLCEELTSRGDNVSKLAKVIDIIDGDTIKVRLPSGQIARVRYIGIDTPELKDKTDFAYLAKELNARLVSDKDVLLFKDVRDTDKYGRLLRYVCVDGLLVNAILVGEGYAFVLTIPPDVRFSHEFLELQQYSQEQQIGLWAQ